jgi:hypothetical protein
MRPSSRAPRTGLFAYAACIAAELSLGAWTRHALAVARDGDGGFKQVERLLDLIGYGYVGLGVGAAIALAAVAGTRRPALGSRVALGAAVATGLGVALELAQRVYLSVLVGASGVDQLERVIHVFGVGMVLADTTAKVLAAIVAVRIGRAASARASLPIALVAFAAIAVDVALYVMSLTLTRGTEAPATLSTIQTASYYVGALFVAGAVVHAGLVLPRVQEPELASSNAPVLANALAPSWGSVASGIGLYLGGAAARLLCALLGYAVMAGGSGGPGTPDLHAMHDAVLGVAVFSGAASLTMLAGVWRITRGPAESGGPGPAMVTLCLMILGLTLDLVMTSITLEALGGSVSAAFFAMDALPLLAGGAALLGVGAGVALLTSFGSMARALGADELHRRAKSGAVLLVIAGGTAGVAVLGLKHMPVEVLGLAAFVVLPVAVAALVQFLRVAVPLGRLIRSRLGSFV